MTGASALRLERIRIAARTDQADSLILCLEAVLRAYGREVKYEELAAMGSPGQGPDDRHEFLAEFGKRYGLEIRELHPPEATPAPPAPREFDWHFRDSYLPFIAAAIERDEPVMASRGWPTLHQAEWGIITWIDRSNGRCGGWTMGGQAILESTPIQIYLISQARE